MASLLFPSEFALLKSNELLINFALIQSCLILNPINSNLLKDSNDYFKFAKRNISEPFIIRYL